MGLYYSTPDVAPVSEPVAPSVGYFEDLLIEIRKDSEKKNPILKYTSKDVDDAWKDVQKRHMLDLLDGYYKQGYAPITNYSMQSSMDSIMYQYLLFVFDNIRAKYNRIKNTTNQSHILDKLKIGLDLMQHLIDKYNKTGVIDCDQYGLDIDAIYSEFVSTYTSLDDSMVKNSSNEFKC